MTITGGRRLTEFLRPPAGTPGNAMPYVDPVTGFIAWGAVVVLPK